MIDPIGAALAAGSRASVPAAVGCALLTGFVTSIGPCIAPRYIAVASIANGYPKPLAPTIAFVSGLVAAYSAIGFAAGALQWLWPLAALSYGMLAIGFIAGGVLTIVRAVPESDRTCCAGRREDASPEPAGRRSYGACFLLGAGSGMVVSPCCTPAIVGLTAIAAALGNPALGSVLLTAFTVGHVAPLLCAASVTAAVRRLVGDRIGMQAPAVVAGTLMLALGAYYGLLA